MMVTMFLMWRGGFARVEVNVEYHFSGWQTEKKIGDGISYLKNMRFISVQRRKKQATKSEHHSFIHCHHHRVSNWRHLNFTITLRELSRLNESIALAISNYTINGFTTKDLLRKPSQLAAWEKLIKRNHDEWLRTFCTKLIFFSRRPQHQRSRGGAVLANLTRTAETVYVVRVAWSLDFMKLSILMASS